MRNAFCLTGVLVLACGLSAGETDASAPTVSRFRVTFDSTMSMEVQGKAHSSTNTIVFEYTRERRGNTITVCCQSMAVTSTADGKTTYEGHMDREKVSQKQNGADRQFLAKDDPDLKTLLDDSFAKPLVTIEVDEAGKEVKQTVSTAPGAKALIDSGAVTTCTLFHCAPNDTKRPISWNLPTGGAATGELTYNAMEAAGDVQVKGSITAEKLAVEHAEAGPKGRNFELKLEGTQHYSAAEKEWISGKVKGPVSFVLETPNGDITAKGEMTVTLERLAK